MENSNLSVIMPNYNHAKYIGEALESILSQSYRPIEVIVIDDGSTDNSIEVIQEFVKKDPIVHLIKNERNMGMIHILKQIEELLEIVKGDYFYAPAADDKILPGFFEKSMNLLARYPDAGLCSTLMIVIDEYGEEKGLLWTPVVSKNECFFPPQKVISNFRKFESWIQGGTVIYRKKAFIEAGGYITGLHSFADGFITQVITLKYGACFIPEPLMCWRRVEEGYAASCSKNFDLQFEIINNATNLMHSTYKELFPPDYIDNWKRKHLYSMNITRFSLEKAQIDKFTNLLSPLNPFDKVFFFILRVFAWFKYMFAKFYIHIRLKLYIRPKIYKYKK